MKTKESAVSELILEEPNRVFKILNDWWFNKAPDEERDRALDSAVSGSPLTARGMYTTAMKPLLVGLDYNGRKKAVKEMPSYAKCFLAQLIGICENLDTYCEPK